MTEERIKELKRIASRLYYDVLDNMGTHKYGHVSGGIEEVIVLAELVEKLRGDLHDWIIDELIKEED